MKYKSLSFKLTVWYAAILAVIITLAGMFLYDRFKSSHTDEMEKKAFEIARTTYKNWFSKHGVTWQDAIDKAEKQFNSCEPFIQAVAMKTHKNRKRRSRSRDREWKQLPRQFFYSSNVKPGTFYFDDPTYNKAIDAGRIKPIFRTFFSRDLSAYPLRTILYPADGHDRDVVIMVGMSEEHAAAELRRLLIILFLAGPLLLVFTSLGGMFIIRKALVPVRSVARAAREITADDLSLRIPQGKRQDEIGELVETFNRMIERLENSVNRIRQFSGDVSHELRTPLTIIRGEIEVLLRKDRDKDDYRSLLESILEETRQMEHIIDDLLLLARLRKGKREGIKEKFSLDDAVLKTYESYIHRAGTKHIRVKLNEVPHVRFNGLRTLVERMISNVIDNAIRYTPGNGDIEITLRELREKSTGPSSSAEPEAKLEITDTGVGIPADELPFIFDRFYVVEKSRSKEKGGTGLGLSIVKLIADIHGIGLDVKSQPGKGTSFTFTFPLD